MIFKFSRNNLSDHVYLFLFILLIFKVCRNNLSGHVYIFHVVMTCYTSTCQHKTTRPCKHYRNIHGVHRRFRNLVFTNTNILTTAAVRNYLCRILLTHLRLVESSRHKWVNTVCTFSSQFIILNIFRSHPRNPSRVFCCREPEWRTRTHCI